MLFRGLVLRKGLLKFALAALSVFALMLSPAQMASALGVGAVKTDSYIGEPFSAWVPLLNVLDVEGLSVEVSSSSIVPDADIGNLESQIVELDNQLNIRITSDQVVNEPYLIFSIRLTEANQVITRDFTVLLDIEPQQGAGVTTRGSTNVQSDVATSLNNSQSEPGAVAFVNAPAILGPYDYAVKGQVPRQFGAVLDGQSLWRVARRINQALDVSINQMMWALYVHNPDAFSTESVDSLRAGQYLTIPTFTEVARVSDAQALSNLNRLSTNQFVSNVEVPAAIETAQSDQTEVNIPPAEVVDDPIATAQSVPEDLAETLSSESAESSFKLSGLDDLGESGLIESNEQSLEVINSLAETVGNLTQEIIRKDKQIEFLEERILAFESIAALDANSTASQQIDSALLSNTSGGNNNLDTAPQSNAFKPWLTWIALFSLALFATLLLRNRFANVFRRREDIEFARKTNFEPTDNQNSNYMDISDKNYSNLAVLKNSNDAEDGFSYISVDHTEDELSLDIDDSDELDESFITIEEEDFDGYLSNLIETKRFDSALNFLKNQRHKYIDEDRYHVERLGVYFAQRNKDAFYAYYDEIEATMQRFNDAANRRISEMVVALEEQPQKKV